MTNNTAAYHGGGIAVTRGEAVVYDTLVTGNSAEVGGGLQVLPPYSYGPVIAAAGRGGGGADGANLIVTQSTISGNQANLIGGGIGRDPTISKDPSWPSCWPIQADKPHGFGASSRSRSPIWSSTAARSVAIPPRWEVASER